MLHLLHGPNILSRDEDIAKMKAQLGDPDLASLNISQLDASATFRDIQSAADATPFLLERRMVVVRNWLKRPAPKRKSARPAADDPLAQLAAYARELPDFTALVLAEDATVADDNAVMKAARDLEKQRRARVKLFEVPANPADWIVERAKAKGGAISRAAANLLAAKINRGNKNDRDHFDEDSRLYLLKLDTELDKLVAYARGREATERDVELLVAEEDVADIFKFTDAMSARDGGAAFDVMRMILARGESPLVVLTHIARQTRMLIQAKENPRLSPDELAQAIGAHPFAAKKVSQQAASFSMAALERAHLRVAETDAAIKSGRMDDLTALEVLVAELCSSAR